MHLFLKSPVARGNWINLKGRAFYKRHHAVHFEFCITCVLYDVSLSLAEEGSLEFASIDWVDERKVDAATVTWVAALSSTYSNKRDIQFAVYSAFCSFCQKAGILLPLYYLFPHLPPFLSYTPLLCLYTHSCHLDSTWAGLVGASSVPASERASKADILYVLRSLTFHSPPTEAVSVYDKFCWRRTSRAVEVSGGGEKIGQDWIQEMHLSRSFKKE